jgi:beta-N-acetylhexosaminidase
MTAFSAPISRRTALRAGGVLAAGTALGLGVARPAQATSPGGLPWHVGLSTEQQVGQRVVFSYPGATPPEELLQWIRDGKVGGLIFFGENILSLQQIADIVTELRQAHAQSPTASSPLMLMTDQEGGYIRRLRGQEPLLSEKRIGLSADRVVEATHAGAGAGAALRNVGMNLNLAPVLDVFREEGNFDDQWSGPTVPTPGCAARSEPPSCTRSRRPGWPLPRSTSRDWARRPGSRTPTSARWCWTCRPARSGAWTSSRSPGLSPPASIW